MSTFPRKWFNSTTNWVKANNLCGNSKSISLSNVLVDGEPKFDDTNSNFNRLIINTADNYFINKTGTLEFNKCFLNRVASGQATSIIGGSINSLVDMLTDWKNLKYVDIVTMGDILWQQIRNSNIETFIVRDCSGLKNNNDYLKDWGIFSRCPKLKVLILENLKIGGFKLEYTAMTRDTIVDFFNSLGYVTEGTTQTIQFGNKLKLLTDDEIKIATDKGWTLV